MENHVADSDDDLSSSTYKEEENLEDRDKCVEDGVSIVSSEEDDTLGYPEVNLENGVNSSSEDECRDEEYMEEDSSSSSEPKREGQTKEDKD